MGKDSFYFSHDYHARHDQKLENAFLDFGLESIGAFWCIVEMLYENDGHIEKNYARIAKVLRAEENMIKCLVENYDLFYVDEKTFTSHSVQRRLQERFVKAQSRIEAGRLGGIRSGEVRGSKSKQDEALLEANEANEPKERKGKERKGN